MHPVPPGWCWSGPPPPGRASSAAAPPPGLRRRLVPCVPPCGGFSGLGFFSPPPNGRSITSSFSTAGMQSPPGFVSPRRQQQQASSAGAAAAAAGNPFAPHQQTAPLSLPTAGFFGFHTANGVYVPSSQQGLDRAAAFLQSAAAAAEPGQQVDSMTHELLASPKAVMVRRRSLETTCTGMLAAAARRSALFLLSLKTPLRVARSDEAPRRQRLRICSFTPLSFHAPHVVLSSFADSPPAWSCPCPCLVGAPAAARPAVAAAGAACSALRRIRHERGILSGCDSAVRCFRAVGDSPQPAFLSFYFLLLFLLPYIPFCPAVSAAARERKQRRQNSSRNSALLCACFLRSSA